MGDSLEIRTRFIPKERSDLKHQEEESYFKANSHRNGGRICIERDYESLTFGIEGALGIVHC